MAKATQQGAALRAVQPRSASPSFDVLDDIVRLPTTRGVLAVRVPGVPEAAAVAGHVARRGAHAGRVVVRASAAVESPWRDVAVRLGIQPVSQDAVEGAHAIDVAASRRRAVTVVPLLSPSAWDERVTQAVAQSDGQALHVLLVSPSATIDAERVQWFEVESRLDDGAAARWWDAVATEARSRCAQRDLAALDSRHAVFVSPEAERPGSEKVSAASTSLISRLSLAHRAWPRGGLTDLVPDDPRATDAVVAEGLLDERDGTVVLSDRALAHVTDVPAGACGVVAEALVKTFPIDPWAFARAAELFVLGGDDVLAEETMRSAFALASDAASRSELWQRWGDAVRGLPQGVVAERRVRGAELALDLGDVDVAVEWAQSAAGHEPSYEAAFVLGRASLARGDLVSARAALDRAAQLASGGQARARVAVELGEVAYAAGDLPDARRRAEEALHVDPVPRVRLGARNIIGKVLLAEAKWEAAERHFAEDACDASFAGEMVCEMRARVNRAIAVLSRGNHDEARPMLESVLADAERRGELRAVGFALSNLAVLATERHDYASALHLAERTIDVRRKLGERLGFARDVTNLVELRLRLGLVGPAEEALRFGRQALGPGAPASRLTELALAAARVHLARGRTLEADREARAALRAASNASDGEKLGECHRLSARVAIEDGLVARAAAAVDRARELASTPFARAEVALLDALVARASGGAPDACWRSAQTAVVACRECGDEELAREAHLVAAEAALSGDDPASASAHVASAVTLRDEVAARLGPGSPLAAAYVGRRELARLEELERLVDGGGAAEGPPESIPPPVRRTSDLAEVYVGRHPLVRALLKQVRKVGPTDATVLIHGGSGTGKELIAEGIHAASTRADGPLVKVNCAALVETLLLSELFGHEKGAFTGAASKKRGRFERASGGTLFLDEIGDISERTQVALLRVLEERTIERVGGSAPIRVDVRIVCATNRDVRAMVERGEFREDLYYRLAGISLEVPSLRDRIGDLPLLCEALLARIAAERGEETKRVSTDALDLLARHPWPGNVRELDNALRSASLFAEGDTLRVADLTENVDALATLAVEAPAVPTSLLSLTAGAKRPTVPPPSSVAAPTAGRATPWIPHEPITGVAYREIRDRGVSLQDMKRLIERRCIAHALDETGGNITRAASLLGMKRPRLSQLVKQYALLSDREEEA